MCNASIAKELFHKLGASHRKRLFNLSREDVHELASSMVYIILEALAEGRPVDLAGELWLDGIKRRTVRNMRPHLLEYAKDTFSDFNFPIQMKPNREFGWRALKAFRARKRKYDRKRRAAKKRSRVSVGL